MPSSSSGALICSRLTFAEEERLGHPSGCATCWASTKVLVVGVLAKCVRLWLPDSHVLWARFRHRLSHGSPGFRESCHCCYHRSTRRLMTNFNHLCSELIELTSQHLNFLSRCHDLSISQFQGNRLRYHARVGNHAKRLTVRCALDDTCCFHLIRLGPKTSVHGKHVSVKSPVTGCDVTNCATTLQGFNKHASSRRQAVSDSRGVPRCTENFQKSTLAHVC